MHLRGPITEISQLECHITGTIYHEYTEPGKRSGVVRVYCYNYIKACLFTRYYTARNIALSIERSEIRTKTIASPFFFFVPSIFAQ